MASLLGLATLLSHCQTSKFSAEKRQRAQTPPAETPNGDPSGTPPIDEKPPVEPGEDPDPTEKGVPVDKLGINFEDLFDNPGNDKDFNDAVLCFSGNFGVNGSQVTSLKEQTVVVQTSSISACRHSITVKVVPAAGGTPFVTTFPSNQAGPVSLPFKKDDVLEVSMTITDGPCTHTTTDMHDASAALVKPDTCHVSGK
jgi:hypothetical protein